ncbi:MAG: sucrose-6-phosphate hydrolase [Clostridiaceae bacterium]|nr:sucrose-6-phosphate hydrolase [Clostridiaceae bacterium]
MMQEIKSLDEVNLQVENCYNSNNFDNWRLNYHFEAPFGLINDPNGLSYYNGEYHLFFQWNPYTCEHKYKHWGLVKTKDFIKYTMPKLVLAPNDIFDKNGCYSGSALVVDDKLEILYTGNVKDEEGNRESYQVRAICDKEGNVTKLGPVVSELPKGYTAHFRDPKVYKKGDKYYFVIGAQTEDLKGRALLYVSEDFASWNYIGEIDTEYKDFGFMWECPSVLNIEGKDVLIFSPQGLEKEEFKNQNIYQSGYLVGNLDYDKLKYSHNEFKELDMGFDFYAPQAFVDDKGRNIMIGWMGLPEEEQGHPTSKYNRSQCWTMARELILKNNIIYQTPIEEYKNLRGELLVDIEDANGSQWASHNITDNSYELVLDLERNESNEVELRFALGDEEYMSFKYEFESGIVVLDRSNMKEGLKGIRKLKMNPSNKLKINMFMDKSAVEIYLNDGEEVMSARIYPEDNSTALQLLSKNGNIKINDMKIWNMMGVKYNG